MPRPTETSPWITDAELAKVAARHDAIAQEPLVDKVRVITVRQPWAWAIMHGGKDVENRSRNIAGDYRGRIAIHAGLGVSKDAFDANALMQGQRHRRFIHGAIIGTVNLWAVHRATPGNLCCPRGKGQWGMAGHWHLCLSDPQPLAEPIPMRGRLGLWTADIDIPATAERNHP